VQVGDLFVDAISDRCGVALEGLKFVDERQQDLEFDSIPHHETIPVETLRTDCAEVVSVWS
jgi:hypothetical protein